MSTKERIIEKTLELMYQQGYLPTSLGQIMEASGVGKGQLYYYFKSKKDLGLQATETLLARWDQELIEEILRTTKPVQERFAEMLEWVYNFQDQQDSATFYGCPVGNLIVELAAQDGDFRRLLADFMNRWTAAIAELLELLHEDWDQEKIHRQAQQILARIQGSLVLLKLNQDLQVLQEAIEDLKQNYLWVR